MLQKQKKYVNLEEERGLSFQILFQSVALNNSNHQATCDQRVCHILHHVLVAPRRFHLACARRQPTLFVQKIAKFVYELATFQEIRLTNGLNRC